MQTTWRKLCGINVTQFVIKKAMRRAHKNVVSRSLRKINVDLESVAQRHLSLSEEVTFFVDLDAAQTCSALLDLANFGEFQGPHGSLPSASAAVSDLQTKIKKNKNR